MEMYKVTYKTTDSKGNKTENNRAEIVVVVSSYHNSPIPTS